MLSPHASDYLNGSAFPLDYEPKEHPHDLNKTEDNCVFTKLDAVLKERKNPQLRTILKRVIVVAELNTELANKQECAAYYQRFFKKRQAQDSFHFSGLLLILPSTCIHVLEGSSELIDAFLLDLNNQPKIKQATMHSTTTTVLAEPDAPLPSPTTTTTTATTVSADPTSTAPTPTPFMTKVPLFKQVKIGYYEDDIPDFSFPFWIPRYIDLKRPDVVYFTPQEQEGKWTLEVESTKEASDCMRQLNSWAHHVGQKLSQVTKPELKSFLDEFFHASKMDLLALPKPELLGSILSSPFVFQIQEWVHLFLMEVPYTIALQDQFVWPAPKRALFSCSSNVSSVVVIEGEKKNLNTIGKEV